jgi:Family of unknown function (DUF6282)
MPNHSSSSARGVRLAALACALLLLVPGLPLTAQQQSNSLVGVIDFHCHTAPDAVPRSLTDLELVRLAKQAGMRGLVLKNHYTMTADRAELAMREVGGIEVFGGIVLNRSVGGINAEAVRRMVQFAGHRGKVIWLPTVDAENVVGQAPGHRPFVSVVKDGKPVAELAEIFQLAAQYDLVLETGHSSPDESLILIAAALKSGVKKIVVTHALGLGATLDQLKRMAGLGAIIECVWLNYLPKPVGANGSGPALAVADCARAIQTVGAEHFLISSDLGQEHYPLHTDGLRAFITALKANGLSEREIDLITRQNPARLLGLEVVIREP